MSCLNVVRVVISPSPTHALGVLVVRHDVVVVGEFLVADGTFPILLDNFYDSAVPAFLPVT